MKNSRLWLTGFFIIVLAALGLAAGLVIYVDPYFHYHAPRTDSYYYTLDNQRSQNDGIIRHFSYDALITGTSMTENFKTTEIDSLFGVSSVKLPFSGATYKEINTNIENAIKRNPDLKLVIRGIDMDKYFDEADSMRFDLGSFPEYLYDDNPFNDVNYIFNRDILAYRIYPMLRKKEISGIDSFDDYFYWMDEYSFGKNSVAPGGVTVNGESGEPVYMTEEEKNILAESIERNIVSLARDNPQVDFYYFITPYSALWWQPRVEDGSIYRLLEAESMIIESTLMVDNIKLFSYNNMFDITTNLNNYKDNMHYAAWINSLMLAYMHDDRGMLTRDNYRQYLNEELEFYISYDFDSINSQEDYEDDYLMAAWLSSEITGVQPLFIDLASTDLMNAVIKDNGYEDRATLECRGALTKRPEDGTMLGDYLYSTEYIGTSFDIEDITDFRYITFRGRKNAGNDMPIVCVYDSDGIMQNAFVKSYAETDNEWHQYTFDISDISGYAKIIFDGSFFDSTGTEEDSYSFCDIVLY